jgi:small multidrug resistance family-3 protein
LILRSVALFTAAAIAEIAGVYLVWLTIRDGSSLLFAIAGSLALAAYGCLAALQSDPHFGRVLAAYGGVFVFGSLLWGMVFMKFHPDVFDWVGAAICLLGAAIIIWGPR